MGLQAAVYLGHMPWTMAKVEGGGEEDEEEEEEAVR
jgi:hypothetical protein